MSLYRIKKIVWPIEQEELKIFIPMALMMLCILFNFGALRSIKDSLVIPAVGAEVISFLKLWIVFPSSIVFTIIYVRLTNKLKFEYIFYIIVTSFLIFFVFFAYIIYPHENKYHPNAQWIEAIIIAYPNFQWFSKIIGKWSYAVLYTCSELWGAVVINLMFWQFSNNIFDIKQARRFYPILGMIGNIGLILAGNVLVFFAKDSSIKNKTILIDNLSTHYETMLQPIIATIFFSGILSMILFRMVNLKISQIKNSDEHNNILDTKTTLPLIESLKMILRSKYIGHIALLIICYGLCTNIIEGPWKAKLRELNPNTLDYINFMGRFNIWMGISCVTFALAASNIIRKFTWLISAILTPIMFSITGLTFFIFVIFSDTISLNFIHSNPIYIAVIIGAMQNVLSKSTKYSLFDATKEIAYIPLQLELRTKGKAAVEVIGTKFGKSLGAFVQSLIFIVIPTATFDSITPYLLMIFITILIIWFWNIFLLNQEYLKKI